MYPADLQLDAPARVANWRPLVHWLLAIPHLIIVQILAYLGALIGLVSWFAVVFTGQLPEGLANIQSMIIRYTYRTYTYAMWLREDYPPFDFTMAAADPGGDPTRIDFQPALAGRNRVTVFFRLILVIPIAIFVAFVGIGAAFAGFIGFFAVLFTGSWPEGLRNFIVRYLRLSVRTTAYFDLLTDEYPPFALD